MVLYNCLPQGLLEPGCLSLSSSYPQSAYLHILSHVLLFLFLLRQLLLGDWVSWALLPLLPPLLEAGDSFSVPLPLGTHHLAARVSAGGVDLKDGLQKEFHIHCLLPLPHPHPMPVETCMGTPQIFTVGGGTLDNSIAQLEGGPERVGVLSKATQLGKAGTQTSH